MILHPPKKIFVVGHSRSGSTLLATRLSQHPLIHATPETHFLDFSTNGNFIWKFLSRWSRRAFVSFATERNHRLCDLAIGRAGVETALQEGFPRFDAAFEGILRQEAELANCPIILEKTPRHLEFLKQIIDWFPEAKVVVILRDGRDATESLLKVDWAHSNPLRLAALWAESVRCALNARMRWPTHVHILRYEDLLANPEKELRSICDFAQLEFSFNMVGSVAQNSIIPDWELGWKQKSGQTIDVSMAQKWRNSENPELVGLVEALIAPELKAMSYELSQVGKTASMSQHLKYKLATLCNRIADFRLRYLDLGLRRKRKLAKAK